MRMDSSSLARTVVEQVFGKEPEGDESQPVLTSKHRRDLYSLIGQALDRAVEQERTRFTRAVVGFAPDLAVLMAERAKSATDMIELVSYIGKIDIRQEYVIRKQT